MRRFLLDWEDVGEFKLESSSESESTDITNCRLFDDWLVGVRLGVSASEASAFWLCSPTSGLESNRSS